MSIEQNSDEKNLNDNAKNELEQNRCCSSTLCCEIAGAVSSLTTDQALLSLTEKAVSITESKGAMLLMPIEKNGLMMPFINSFDKTEPTIRFERPFYEACFSFFVRLRADNHSASLKCLELETNNNEAKQTEIWPVMLSGKPICLLAIIKYNNQAPTDTHQKSILGIITAFMGSLFENLRQNNELIHKNSRLSALYEISQQTEMLIDFRDIYDTIGKVARSFINFDTYILHFLSGDGKTLEARGSSSNLSIFPPTIELGQGAIGKAAQELKPCLTYTAEFNSVLILPIELSRKLIGVLTIGSKKSYAYRDEDIIGLRIIATHIASIDRLFKNLISLKGFTEGILQSINSGVLIFDNVGKLTFANSAIKLVLERTFSEDFSFDADEAMSLPAQLRELMIKVLATNITVENKKVKIKNGQPGKIVEINAFPFRNELGSMMGTAFFIKDITQITELEEQLRRADKLSALGMLSAGVAHEMRNPLTGMKMIIQLLESECDENDSRKESLNILQTEIGRLDKIISSLLGLVRPSREKITDFIVEQVVNDCYALMQGQMKKQNVNFIFKSECGSSLMEGDPDLLKQVFINIMTNAVQSMPTGGNLTVSVARQNGFVVARFEDTGAGIAPDKLRDIFNPFMTTKNDGTGLGLSTALRIVEEHRGKIDVQSTLGHGSVFSVFLPAK